MMSALVRHHFSSIVNATQSLRPHPLSARPILRQPPTWAGFGSAFAGLRTGIGREVGHGARQTSRSAQRSRIVSLGTPSLLFHDRRAPRPHQISRSGPIALQVHAALFHASRPNQGLPFIWLATVLKTSTALAFAQTAGRITMSLLPVIFLKLKFASRFLRKVPADHPHYAQKREKILRIRWKLWVAVGVLVVVPLSLFVSAILASLERTPLTGRVRLIMLSAEEEEEIARELKGAGWYTSVAQILVNASPSGTMPRVIPPDDWRWNWVEQTLRQLERAVPKLQEHSDNPAAWYAAWVKEHPGETHAHLEGPEWKTSAPIPPPPHYPLVPRPRVAQLLHEIPVSPTVEGHKHGHGHHHSPHAQLGPPYSLLLVDLPESNALSYGFGGDGGGGIVVYSGFLDEVLGSANKPSPQPKPGSKSLLSGLFFTSDASSKNNEPPQPTPEQTQKLATLLAHELSHLLLSHHLETLSSGTIFLPSVIGIVSDVVRVLLFPITMVMGPFVNDAVANFTKVGLDDIARSGSTCQSRELEFEADIVSARILASAGFDPQCAVEFWEGRQLSPPASQPLPDTDPSQRVVTPLPSVPGTFWTSRSTAGEDDSHPLDQARVHRLKRELRRWEREKAYAMGKMKIDSWARGACEASIKGLKWKLDKQPCKDQNWE
ncbi:Peptidase family M48 [Rhizoctonia solani]|uniref:Peptidase family M48 n=1 Tax=Rhizoctonia solani TaxID=456999 RepID=A0A8H7H3U7_9AGAM|nr:Peptidase family M48 [Rhizoctonia solani]